MTHRAQDVLLASEFKSERLTGAESHAQVAVPACLAAELVIDSNSIHQLIAPETQATIISKEGGGWEDERFALRLINGSEIRLVRSVDALRNGERGVVPRRVSSLKKKSPQPADLGGLRWVGNLERSKPAEVLASLEGAFSFLRDDPDSGKGGLRVAQLGAIHAVLAHWTMGTFVPATVVMPTGTGKTEAMLGLLASARPSRLLVIVPSDALRDQVAAKFETFGVLQTLGVVRVSATRPVVGRVEHAFTSPGMAVQFATSCNVIVATPSALGASTADARLALLGECTHLFVDEAHHVAAATWTQIRDEFVNKYVVQFTATPFREDGRRLGGRIIYSFPLREAQKQGYFSKINYYSVADFENPDATIARKAIERLRSDLSDSRDHILMARANRIGRAEAVLAIYQELAPDLDPVLLHSRVSGRARQAALAKMRARTSRIIVCVDMLGEGFDLPSLKVAAIHDPHRSLGVTLQFVGRFARVAGETIGEATVVVGRPDSDYDDNLRKLYAEDADWNLIIRNLSEAAIGQEEEVGEFEAAFNTLPEEVSLANLLPKMSTVVYRTSAALWTPENIINLFPEESLLTVPIPINAKDHVAWFVTEIATQVTWGDSRTVQDLMHQLYVLYWDSDRQLLYVNSSDKGFHEELAKVVCGDDVRRIAGEIVYRTMAQVDRLVPTNVGVLDVRNRSRRFSMHVGADVIEGFPVAEAQTKTKTNIFAYGFEKGIRVSVGASLKGRVWSYRIAPSLKHWIDWCDHVGGKLIDNSISVDEVMDHFIRPKVLEERPALVALALEWPWEVFLNLSEEVRLQQGGDSWALIDVDLEISTFSTSGPIPFQVVTPAATLQYEAVMGDGKVLYKAMGSELHVVTRHLRTPLSEWLGRAGLTIHFEQDATVTPDGLLLQFDRELPPFDPERLVDLDWSGVNIRKESQGAGRDPDSVQARVIRHIRGLAEWDLVIDDDGTGEVADIVAMRVDDKELQVLLVHCKYSSEDQPGYRVGDLYEVCGQAQKSVNWRRNIPLLFRNLERRERGRRQAGAPTGFQVGTAPSFYQVEEKARHLRSSFTMAIAQPGLSKASVSKQQLELLASTEVYVRETANAPLMVFCSA
jgi:superfamily II DNA or RNA helicase